MCGRYTLRTSLPVLARQFQFDLESACADVRPRYNICPTQEVLAVRVPEPGAPRELALLHWGLIPSWAKDPKIARSTINARAETIATKPAFRAAFNRRRCLVLADGYYEWLRVGKTKQPYLYEIDGGQPFALAGLWESWRGPATGRVSDSSDPPLESCTLITTEANALAAEVHNRMPVILDPADYDAWLDPATCDAAALAALLAPFPTETMQACPVDKEYLQQDKRVSDPQD